MPVAADAAAVKIALHKIQNTKHKIQNTKYKIQNTKVSIDLQRDRLGGWDVVKAGLWGEFCSNEGKTLEI